MPPKGRGGIADVGDVARPGVVDHGDAATHGFIITSATMAEPEKDWPPSAISATPVRSEARGEARKAVTAATSSIVPKRPTGT